MKSSIKIRTRTTSEERLRPEEGGGAEEGKDGHWGARLLPCFIAMELSTCVQGNRVRLG